MEHRPVSRRIWLVLPLLLAQLACSSDLTEAELQRRIDELSPDPGN